MLLQRHFLQTLAGGQCLFGNLGAVFVTDVGVKGSDDTDGVFDHVECVAGIDGDALHALLAERVHGMGEPCDALEEALGDDGLHDVELQLTGLGGEAYGGVVADDLEAYLIGDLGDDRIHLAGHDGRAGCHGWQIDLVQSAAGTGGHEAQVVAYLGELDSQALEGSTITYIGTGVGGSLDHV